MDDEKGPQNGPENGPENGLAVAPDRAGLMARLDALQIAHRTVEHPAVFTVEEGRDLKASMPGAHSKNLFVKDKKGALYLISAWAETRIDLVGLGKALGAKGRFSFGKPELMSKTLGVIPGAVTPFALFHESAHALAGFVLDAAFMDKDPLWFHPLENTASTAIGPRDLVRFAESCGFTPEIMDLAAPAPA
ncbi:MAG: prolyl-tRNA synthetase associated domain-containing protein [Pseudomonadota bacterium]